jgi:hypothetical protein
MPVDEYWAVLRRMLPRTFLAYGIGGLVGFSVGLALDGSLRFPSFVIVFLAVSFFLMQRLSPGQGPLQGRALTSHPRLSMAMASGVLLWGVPMAILFSGMAILEPKGTPMFKLIFVGIMIVVGGLGGLAFGALLHLIRRLSEPEQDVRGGQ